MILPDRACSTHRGKHQPLLSLPTYNDICDYIETGYRRCYEANIRCDYPHLLVALDIEGTAVAAVGYRPADSALFLEQYLNEPAQYVLSAVYKEPVCRSSVVEIGNLVGDDSRAVFSLMQALWNRLYQHHYRYALLTCTQRLKRRFRYLPMHQLVVASNSRVSNHECWGRYFQESPVVMTGRLQEYDQRFSRVTQSGRLYIYQVSGVESE